MKRKISGISKEGVETTQTQIPKRRKIEEIAKQVSDSTQNKGSLTRKNEIQTFFENPEIYKTTIKILNIFRDNETRDVSFRLIFRYSIARRKRTKSEV